MKPPELINKYGSAENIPKKVLDENELIRIIDGGLVVVKPNPKIKERNLIQHRNEVMSKKICLEKRIIKELCESKKYKYKFCGDDPSIIILGEYHYSKHCRQQQEVVIKLVKPEFLLSEHLRVRFYDPKTKKIEYLPKVLLDSSDIHMDKYELNSPNFETVETRRLIDLANKYQCVLVGIDLSIKEMSKYPGSLNSHKVTVPRERRMGERMAEFYPKTAKPFVAIMGDYHVRQKSEIHPILQKENIDYVVIHPPSL